MTTGPFIHQPLGAISAPSTVSPTSKHKGRYSRASLRVVTRSTRSSILSLPSSNSPQSRLERSGRPSGSAESQTCLTLARLHSTNAAPPKQAGRKWRLCGRLFPCGRIPVTTGRDNEVCHHFSFRITNRSITQSSLLGQRLCSNELLLHGYTIIPLPAACQSPS